MAMTFDRRELIDDVIRRLTLMRDLDADSLDTLELMVNLEEEFGTEPVKWAFRFLEARGVGPGTRRLFGKSDPMWDRDLDG